MNKQDYQFFGRQGAGEREKGEGGGRCCGGRVIKGGWTGRFFFGRSPLGLEGSEDPIYLASLDFIVPGLLELAVRLTHVVASLSHAVFNSVHQLTLPQRANERQVSNGDGGWGLVLGLFQRSEGCLVGKFVKCFGGILER